LPSASAYAPRPAPARDPTIVFDLLVEEGKQCVFGSPTDPDRGTLPDPRCHDSKLYALGWCHPVDFEAENLKAWYRCRTAPGKQRAVK